MDRVFKDLLLAIMAYEAAAITTGRVPMLSTLCRRHRVVEAVLLAVLLAHLHHKIDQASCSS